MQTLKQTFSDKQDVLNIIKDAMLCDILITDFIRKFRIDVGMVRELDCVIRHVEDFITDPNNFEIMLDYGIRMESLIKCNSKCFNDEISGGKSTRLAKYVKTE